MNGGHASAGQVLELARYIQHRVENEFGVVLQPEPARLDLARGSGDPRRTRVSRSVGVSPDSPVREDLRDASGAPCLVSACSPCGGVPSILSQVRG